MVVLACSCALCRNASSDFAAAGTESGRVAATITGVNHIDSLLAGSAYRWNSGSSFGTAVSVTFSFMTSAPAVADANEQSTFMAFTEGQKAGARAALALYAEVCNLTFTELSDSESINIRFANNNQNGQSAAYAYYPNGSSSGGQVWLAADYSYNFIMTAGSYGFMTVLHEIGHAVGLKHPGNYNATGGGTDPPYLPSSEDTYQYSLMSYHGESNNLSASTLMLYDIAALQYLYGANTSTRSGDTTYTFDTSAVLQTIWDGGGNDTLDASNQTRGVTLDLRAGAYSSIGTRYGGAVAVSNNIAIAYGVVIENAVGGDHDDVLYGNTANNRIEGGAGNDTISGLGGNDTILGGGGNDEATIDGGTCVVGGVETLIGGAGSDWVTLMSGGNTLELSAIETLIGGSGADFVTLGGGGNTVILAALETLAGGTGGDFIRLGDRGSTLRVSGLETLIGGSGVDVIYLGNGGNTMILAALETLIGGEGTDLIRLGDRGGTLAVSALETVLGGSGGDYLRLDDAGGTLSLSGVETLVGGAGSETIALGGSGNTLVMVAIDTLLGGTGGDFLRLGDRGNTLFLSGVETLVGGSGLDRVQLGNTRNMLVMAAVDTLLGGTGPDFIRLGDRSGTVVLGGVETVIGGSGADVVTLLDGPVWFQGREGGDTLVLTSPVADMVAYGSVSDGGAAGTIAGADTVSGFTAGSDRIAILSSLREAVDRDGNGILAAARRAAGGASLLTDELIVLTGTEVVMLDEDGFASFRAALGTVATDGTARNALVLTTAGSGSGLYFVSDDGDGRIAAAEVRLLARFSGTALAATDVILVT